MGHYYAEMFPNERDDTFDFRYAKYKQECAREISDIIKDNPISFEEINVGDKLTLYLPLKGLSKIRFDNHGEYHKIRERFSSGAKIYGIEMSLLSWVDEFEVFDKREMKLNDDMDEMKKTRWYEIRIDEPDRKVCQPFPRWINIKYVEKI